MEEKGFAYPVNKVDIPLGPLVNFSQGLALQRERERERSCE
jgi:hypothetical protein